MLTTAAFNAFLKTLEEPPSYAKFILATTEKHKVLPTILSRCQIYDFNRIKVADIQSHLEKISKTESMTNPKNTLPYSNTALSVFCSPKQFVPKGSSNRVTVKTLSAMPNCLRMKPLLSCHLWVILRTTKVSSGTSRKHYMGYVTTLTTGITWLPAYSLKLA